MSETHNLTRNPTFSNVNICSVSLFWTVHIIAKLLTLGRVGKGFKHSSFPFSFRRRAGFLRVVPDCEELAGRRLELEEQPVLETKDLTCRFQLHLL